MVSPDLQRLSPAECVVCVIDVQEKLATAMPPESIATITRAVGALAEAATLLGVRMVATEQYPQGLGSTLPAVRQELERTSAPVFSKMTFSAMDHAGFHEFWNENGRPNAVVVGMETHICVFQTVRDLLSKGVRVWLPIDGVASRRDDHRQAGIAMCNAIGAITTTTESLVFDWLREAGTEAFRLISRRIR